MVVGGEGGERGVGSGFEVGDGVGGEGEGIGEGIGEGVGVVFEVGEEDVDFFEFETFSVVGRVVVSFLFFFFFSGNRGGVEIYIYIYIYIFGLFRKYNNREGVGKGRRRNERKLGKYVSG